LNDAKKIGIVGGGLAGLAAAVALVERGFHVELFEARRKLGGRAGSYIEPVSGESIDHCQHVAMGCCTNFLDFCCRTGVSDLLQRYKTLHFFGPDGKRSDFWPSAWLPAPLHLALPLLSLRYLSWRDKLGIARAMWALARVQGSAFRVQREGDRRQGTGVRGQGSGISGQTPLTTHHSPATTMLQWLQKQRQTPEAIERFWKVVLVSALADSLDRVSVAAARKVFVDGFMAHREAADVLVPAVSLGELYDERVAGWLREHGAQIHLESPVEEVIAEPTGGARVRVAGSALAFDFVIVAVPRHRLGKLLSPALRAVVDPSDALGTIESAPISSVHLWFDRQLTDLPHAVFVGRLSQWMFARDLNRQSNEHYYQVVISGSHDLACRDRQSVVDEVLGDLASAFSGVKAAGLLRWQVITDKQAVFSASSSIEAIRPAQQTVVRCLLLAGDWTRTGWPATMEGAVRSGYLAAEAILEQLGRPETIVVPDLPRNWLTRRL
jgi:squalene-associated FAD-dependent desaturase